MHADVGKKEDWMLEDDEIISRKLLLVKTFFLIEKNVCFIEEKNVRDT
jgi:hypothetical protein